MLTISHNKSSIIRSCLKKYDFRYNQQLTPNTRSMALTLGASIHDAFDMYYKGFPVEEVVKYIVKSFDDEIDNVGLQEQEDLVIAKYTSVGMFTNFPFKDLGKFQEIESEKSFSVKVGNLRGVRYEGRLDGLVKKDNNWWVRELKTSGLNQRQFESRINVSSQSTGYMYAMRKLGYDVKGTLYDYIKKPLLRKRVNEDAVMFGMRIMNDYGIKKEMYYGQLYSWRNESEMKLWEEDIISTIQDIRRRKTYPRNPEACYNYNYECPYKKICFVEKPDPLMLSLYFRHDGKEIKQQGVTNE